MIFPIFSTLLDFEISEPNRNSQPFIGFVSWYKIVKLIWSLSMTAQILLNFVIGLKYVNNLTLLEIRNPMVGEGGGC